MQEWTKLSNPNAQGVVKKHRSGSRPESPPDNQTIQLQMAIVSWQPGPNRILEVPNQVHPSHVIYINGKRINVSRNPLVAVEGF